MNWYGTLPINILRNKNLSSFDKIIYMELTSRVGLDGKMSNNLHGMAMTYGVKHGAIKHALNNLARQNLVWKIAGDISLSPPDSQQTQQLEIDLEFVGEILRKWNEVFKKDLPEGVKNTAILTGTVSDCQLSFSKDDMMASIERWYGFCSQDRWWSKDENKLHRANIVKFFSNEERVNQALNFKVVGYVSSRSESEDKGLLN